MKVKDLIELLSQYDPDIEVFFDHDSLHSALEVDSVILENKRVILK